MAVRLPDMFVSFMASPASVNPHLEEVRGESEGWLIEYGRWAYLCSMWSVD